ncbi:UDP-3-O-(3-hydroxymyristoyl) N-acetylglucosamine deacetylase [alpha proteobacterium HIMB114]|nr:UDP-3-O-(3-hydroxymyristoyl) N-acetylglucosamine deacetylase [alpha proteobacterium HIMB114]
MFSNQKTILKEVSFSGIGLHSGELVNITLLPDDIDTGINFFYKKKKIKASWKNAEISQLCTKIKKDNVYLSTIEHLMSALCGLGVTNLLIKISSGEVPILDGSAKDFVNNILKIGFKEQKKKRKFIKLKKTITFEDKKKFIKIVPTNENKFTIDYTIDYKDELIKKQQFLYNHSYEDYKKIYLARTFCLQQDLEKIFAMGLAKGGSLENAIVVSGNKILNQGGLRYKDEFVRHKVLDCIGDLYLSEHQILGEVTTSGGGHELNLMLLKKIFEDKDNFDVI